MKFIFFVALLFQLSFSGGVYDISLANIEGNQLELRQFKGRKLLLFLLPYFSQITPEYVRDLSRLQERYKSSVVVIGIPAVESGYRALDAGKLKRLCKKMRVNFIITDIMKVEKGIGQSSLFEWLTNKNLNHHFDQVGYGVGSKYFVDEEGQLYAVIGPNTAFNNPKLDRVLDKSVVFKQ